MDQFVAHENVRRPRRQLEGGAEPEKRSTMLKILIEEENKLGHTREQLDRLERHISRLAVIMARQVELIDQLRSLWRPVERPQMVLSTLNDVMATYIAHCQRINAAF